MASISSTCAFVTGWKVPRTQVGPLPQWCGECHGVRVYQGHLNQSVAWNLSVSHKRVALKGCTIRTSPWWRSMQLDRSVLIQSLSPRPTKSRCLSSRGRKLRYSVSLRQRLRSPNSAGSSSTLRISAMSACLASRCLSSSGELAQPAKNKIAARAMETIFLFAVMIGSFSLLLREKLALATRADNTECVQSAADFDSF